MIELKEDVKFNEQSLKIIVDDIQKYKKQKKGALFAIRKMAKRNVFTVNEIVDKLIESNVITVDKKWSDNIHNKTGFSVVSNSNTKNDILWDGQNKRQVSSQQEQTHVEEVTISLSQQAKEIGMAKELFNMWLNISGTKRPLFNKDKINIIKNLLVEFSLAEVRMAVGTKIFVNEELVKMGYEPSTDLTDFKAVFDRDSIAEIAKVFR